MFARLSKRILAVCLFAWPIAFQISPIIAQPAAQDLKAQRIIRAKAQQIELIRLRGKIQQEQDNGSTIQVSQTLTHEEILAQHSIEPTIESIGSFLDELHPDEDLKQRATALILELGHPDFDTRERATAQLIRMNGIPPSMYDAALNGDDPEIAFRAKQVLALRDSSATIQLQLAVLQAVRKEQLAGLTNKIISAFPQLSSASARHSAAAAIEETAETSDLELLQETLRHQDDELTVAALKAIVRLQPDASLTLLNEAGYSDRELVKLTAAQLLAKLEQPACLDVLVDLLNAEELAIRGKAYALLRGISDQKIAYSLTANADERAESIAAWRAWVAANKDSVEIKFVNRTPRLGRILVGLYTQGKVVELDMAGKLLWEAPAASAFACQGLPNGHRLVGHYSLGKLTEYDEKGIVVKEFSGLSTSISGVWRLENGNTLIAAGQSNNELQEIDPDGKTVWKKSINGTPMHAAVLENGLMLVSFNATNQIAEVDQNGKVHWEISVDKKPYSATRLLNGNTLVAFNEGGIAEYDPVGEKTREFTSGINTYHVQELDTGNLIYADQAGLHIIDPSGKEIWSDNTYQGYLYLNYY